ncbi:hypothetical protein QWY16_03075 [Planococcus shenhongbingii]|uniref:YqzL family protein n=1 Tax=Planococcus shenhongbingii TaxID=3058398 RepID=A0ABT8NF77_9BACL|nr:MULTISPECIES: hypothetical protein [unclassified Planococcus (in: firmicutes)]MDN7246140.1 hypothetical protein [Planococcus sp. N017]WKA59149.1 hypothetical protein QWY16_03075 [Planococcus sp. N016]
MKKKEKKDRWWIWDVFEFFIDMLDILLYIPRYVIRLVREL